MESLSKSVIPQCLRQADLRKGTCSRVMLGKILLVTVATGWHKCLLKPEDCSKRSFFAAFVVESGVLRSDFCHCGNEENRCESAKSLQQGPFYDRFRHEFSVPGGSGRRHVRLSHVSFGSKLGGLSTRAATSGKPDWSDSLEHSEEFGCCVSRVCA